MLKKTITYKDFNGDEVVEDHFFHLSQAELVELELSHKGGLQEAIKRIVDAEDGKAIIAEFKNIILSSYGQRSSDGKRFIKNDQLRQEFESTEAYSTLFMELVTNADAAAEFVRGIVPQNMAEEVARVTALTAVPDQKDVGAINPDTKPVTGAVPRTMTRDEMMGLTAEELVAIQQQIADGGIVLVP